MADLLTAIGSFFTTAIGWAGDVLDVIVGNPALLIMVIAMPVIGFGVGLLGRLFRV